MEHTYITYAKHMNADHETLEWIERTLLKYAGKNSETQTSIEHVIDYMCSTSKPRKIRRMSYPQAKLKAVAWNKTLQKKGAHIHERDEDIEMVHDFLDGTKIVKLIGKPAFEREGYLMRHCVGSYSFSENRTIYSYRDHKNMPHATMEVLTQDGGIQQIKGKGNGAIHPRYILPILAFLKTIGVSVRSSEMQNLGYYCLNDQIKEILENFEGVPEYTELYGNSYLVKTS